MTIDKLVDSTQLDSDLTDVADEIRTAGGTLLPLSFPDDYVVAIGDIGNTEIKTASGSIAHFEDALARKAQDLTVAIEPVQSGSGDPSPDNVRPISGWTGANVTRTGKNLLNFDDVLNDAFVDGTTKKITTISGANVWYANVPKNTQITYSADKGNRLVIAGYKVKPTTVLNSTADVLLYNSGEQLLTKTFNSGENTFVAIYPNRDQANKPTWIQLELGSTATAYEPYFGNTYSITFPSEAGTVYGGTLDVTTGKLTVDRAIYDFGAGVVGPVNVSEDARSQGLFSAYGFTPTVARVSDISAVTAPDGIICNQFVAAPNNAFLSPGRSPAEASFSQYATSFYVQWSALAGKTNAEAKTLLTGVQISAPLATPIVYDLTPTEVTTLLGTNNVWADTGDSTVQYIAPKAQIPSAQGVYF